jgi:hypothetical protein
VQLERGLVELVKVDLADGIAGDLLQPGALALLEAFGQHSLSHQSQSCASVIEDVTGSGSRPKALALDLALELALEPVRLAFVSAVMATFVCVTPRASTYSMKNPFLSLR